MGGEGYGVAAFLVDSVGVAYMALVMVWVMKVKYDGEFYGPLQAMQRIAWVGQTWLMVSGVVFGVVIGTAQIPLAGVSVVVGAGLAGGIIALTCRFPCRPFAEATGWRKARRFVLFVATAVTGIALVTVFGAWSSEVGGMLDRTATPR